MAISLTFDPIQVYGKEMKILEVAVTVGGTGAVSSVAGKGFAATSSDQEQVGTVTRNGVGNYSIVLPGNGSVNRLVPVGPPTVVSSADADKSIVGTFDSITLNTRTVVIQFFDVEPGTAVDAELSSGAVFHCIFMVKNTDVD